MARFGGAVCVLEPQVKEGPGGLRDLHAVLWVAHALLRQPRPRRPRRRPGLLEAADYARGAPGLRLPAAGAQRGALRHRPQDRPPHPRPAGRAGARLGYRAARGLLASELLMRDYYRRAFRLHEICRAFVETHLEPKPRRRFFASLRLPRSGKRTFDEKDGVAPAARRARASGAATALLEAFERAQHEGVPPSRELRKTLRERAELVGGRFRRSREAGAALLRLVEPPRARGPTLRALHETGDPGAAGARVGAHHLPRPARLLPQVHGGRAHAARGRGPRRAGGGPGPAAAPLARLLDELDGRARPSTSACCCTTSPRAGAGATCPRAIVLTRRILSRLAVDEEVAETAVFLVGAHLEMSQISQQRDLSEPRPSQPSRRAWAASSSSNLLMLLTYADHRGVGPGIWNEWKGVAALGALRAHAPRARGDARDGGSPTPPRASATGAVADLGRYFPDGGGRAPLRAAARALPPRDRRGAARAATSASCARAARGAAAFEWADRGDGRGTELTVTAEDRPGLFALLAGTLTVQGIDILGADLFARNDGVVLDTLRVAERPGQRPLRPERRVRLEAALHRRRRLGPARRWREAVEKWRAQPRAGRGGPGAGPQGALA